MARNVRQDAGLSPDLFPEIDGLGEGEMQPALLALSQHELIERPEDQDVDSLEPLDRRLRGNVAIQEVRQPLPIVHDVADAALGVIGLDDLPGGVGEFDDVSRAEGREGNAIPHVPHCVLEVTNCSSGQVDIDGRPLRTERRLHQFREAPDVVEVPVGQEHPVDIPYALPLQLGREVRACVYDH